MYFGKKAALSLRQHRISLEKAHKWLLADLAKHLRQPYPASLSERIELLRAAHRAALIESIRVFKTITSRVDILNLASAMEALHAERSLAQVCQVIAKTLDEIDEDGSRTRSQ